ncbi:probable inactive purple acid phosphatase 28 isoform X1 [Zingiber officinale]|uniref:probable inactive purple acid phosphatase 28 isoform X1 n=1 Tax=Zingiber officinale TaxID=94328 RepID=UPI001C4B68AA|nr:probable inactive purple acid phosphatase 28 isoform X1 [Zingiber officinale]XP_042432039.1 probable inactive purple acid phosphatase 28 isoform X1 [Zingiber officinale]XP_042432040.1 probable inactive purple acid phosphatase 28 isoform X1 [Zingiber officinale]
MRRRPWRRSFFSHLVLILFFLPLVLFLCHSLLWVAFLGADAVPRVKRSAELPLRFRSDGSFKILQVADMHYGNGLVTRCRDVLPSESSRCTDVNSTVFLKRMIEAERPDLIAFTGDNIFGASATDAAESLFKVFRPAMESRIPWAAILGNHDQESTMPRVELMSFISLMDYSVAQVNPSGFLVDGYGNYDIKVHGAWDSGLANTSVLNLYFLDSGDRAMVGGRRTYGWIKDSQLTWLRAVSEDLQRSSNLQQSRYPAPSLSFFHIPIPEVRELWFKGFVGQFQEAIACSSVNSGVLQTLVSMGDVKAVFIGHDHLNDFCGNLDGIWFCYGGGFGYHGYGKPSWRRRARVVLAQLGKGKGTWMGVEVIKTWKRLDDDKLTKIDEQVLWRRDPWEGQ